MASEPTNFGPDAFQRLLEGERGIPVTAPTTAAFIGRTERGPVDEPVKIASFDDFRRAFGGHCPFSFLSFAVQHFFAQGGQAAVVVRVANRATRARLALPAGDGLLRLQARVPGGRVATRSIGTSPSYGQPNAVDRYPRTRMPSEAAREHTSA